MTAAKRIIICCDGTWNAPDDDPTNVTKLVRSIKPQAADGMHQVVFYDNGIGTGDAVDKYIGGAFGYGMEKNVLDGYRFLVHNYHLGDELYFLGFSRGAFTARALVGLVSSVGLIEKDGLDQLKNAYQYYRTAPEKRPTSQYESNYKPDIQMVGVFDTVGALGAPTRLLGKLTKPWVGFYNTHISSLVKHAYHALALDERRGPFIPDLWTGSLKPDQVMEQCWFAGAHADIGGGYQQCGLSDITLLWMVNKARNLGLDFNQHYLETLCKPDLHMQPHNSYSFSYKILEKLGGGESVRNIYGEADNPPINISIHDSVYQRIAAGAYQPQNPDFPAADKLADRRGQSRYLAGNAPASLQWQETAASCQLLDISKGGGARILFQGKLDTGDEVALDSEQFGHNSARCVWKKGNQYGLQFAA
ncbi:phospholipase effector Tle1 domain-containing protein [Rheinheimera maricola]|uniref:DUF2235 domain-containing protein n=1 Tax=Rheinheimera maricola TaxID=2793282 RepID=A0ABS7XEM6_9GAMM|nr:DUF2235 domain-containing protein [Rheinheimera maricola]MBZ9613212.1 DUF2235 domain-containing protein [Rheinheimera maricola]